MLNREECDNALTRLLRPYFAKVSVQDVYHSINKGYSIEEDSNLLTLLIMEYFDNPPLKFEELKEGMWVWDDKEEMWIHSVNNYDSEVYGRGIRVKFGFDLVRYPFEENRFYRKEV